MLLVPIIFLFGLTVGLSLIIKPEVAIEIQRRFYAKINWNIEPISMEKEVRNTRIMGWFLIALVLATLIFILT